MSAERVHRNDLHAAVHEVSAELYKAGALFEDRELRLRKFPHLPYWLTGDGSLNEYDQRKLDRIFIPAKEPGHWVLGTTPREALLVLEATLRTLKWTNAQADD